MTVSKDSTIVTRFAPSPTGYLHVGGARTALFSWLLARHAGGKFFLRIEDTDLARSTDEACRSLLEDLKWLGLHWDNAELMHQSKRLHLYNELIDNLIQHGLAYKAYDTEEELTARRKQAEREKRSYLYRRAPISEEQVHEYKAQKRPHVVRFAMPVTEYRFRDAVLGKEIVFAPDQVQDFVIRKGDGMPTYHFAVVVDDAAMGVTHILRGQEHLLNTFNHIAIQEALGYLRPVYGHLPIIMNLDGTKMGKRDRDKKIRERANAWVNTAQQDAAALAVASGLDAARVAAWLPPKVGGETNTMQLDLSEQSAVMKAVGMQEHELPEILVHDFRKNGYLPETLLNFLALLGWSPGENRERLSMQEMVELFSIEGIGKSNAKFSRDKLLAFNTEACAAASPERLVAAMRDFLAVNPASPLHTADDAALARVMQMKKGFRTLREAEATTRFLFLPDDAIVYDPDAVEKVLRKQEGQGLTALREIRTSLAGVSEWAAHPLEEAVKLYCEQKQLGLGKVAQPIRVAVCGSTVSPPIFESLEFLGRERTLARIDRCIAAV